MKVLIKSAGNKKRLIQEFQKYAEVVVQDDDPCAKCFLWADCWITGSAVDLIIKTRDADIKHPFCHDKLEFECFCRRHGFKIPETWVCDPEQRFLIKPRNGGASKNQMILDRSYLVQEFIDWPEYSIDYFADSEGNPISVIPRKRLDVWEGESHRAEIVYDPLLITEGTRMGRELDIRGPATMQVFFNGKDVRWIEVNPRYGGGSYLTWHIFSGPKYQVQESEKQMRESNVSTTFKGTEVR